MKFWKSCVLAFSLYTKIPMPFIDADEDARTYLFCFFPAIGLVIALLLLVWIHISDAIGLGIVLKTAVYVAIPFFLTGGIHYDGFLDVTDANASYGSREKKLAIMDDPHTGAFALAGGIVYYLLFFAGTFESLQSGFPGVCLIFVISRALTGYLVMTMRSAHPGGMLDASTEKKESAQVNIVLIVWGLLFLFLMMCIGGARMGIPGAVGIGWCFFFRWWANRRFGGITGDLAGYHLTWSELIMTLAFAVVSAL
jgi:adenosylcobinamide-GDP ribazoletransferase